MPARAVPEVAPALKRPESVLVVVATGVPSVLMLRRVRPEGFWQSVTGSLEPGETIWDAALREIAEETGIVPDPARLTDHGLTRQFRIHPDWVARFPPGTRFNTEHLLSYHLDEEVAVTLRDHEHVEYRWLSPGDALQQASSWTDRAAIRSLFGPGPIRGSLGGESGHDG